MRDASVEGDFGGHPRMLPLVYGGCFPREAIPSGYVKVATELFEKLQSE
jgi:hypothetical protein